MVVDNLSGETANTNFTIIGFYTIGILTHHLLQSKASTYAITYIKVKYL